MNLPRLLTIFSAVAFLGYGGVCLTSDFMVSDFKRFGLEHLRITTGVLEILGGAGLLVGLRVLPIQIVAAGGLALLMLIAFCIRLDVRDSIAASAPSLLFSLLNLYLFVRALQTRS